MTIAEHPEITVVVPVYRSAPTLRELCARLRSVLDGRGRPYELLFIDDASPDGSAELLNELARAGSIAVVRLPANGGQHRAVVEGLRRARGSTVVILDADLQDPPEAIPVLLDRLAKGYAAVYAARRGHYQPWLRRLTSRIFKTGMRLLAGVPADMGPFAAMDRRMVESVVARADGRPYLPALVSGAGLPFASVPVARTARAEGHSAYRNRDRFVMGVAALWTTLRSRRAPRV